MNSAKYLRAWRRRIRGTVCECGEPAVTIKFGEKVCARCASMSAGVQVAAGVAEDHHQTKQRVIAKWEHAAGEQEPICGASLILLEARLCKL